MIPTDTQKAKKILQRGGYTCVLYRNGAEYHSDLKGIKPLLDYIETGHRFTGFSAADKTVGAAAAYLYVLLGVQSVWAKTLSESGLNILKSHGITVGYEHMVPVILNRTGDGVCPMEAAVQNAASPEEALRAIRKVLAR